MIRVPCMQGSKEWLAARLGRPTASGFDRIVTPSGKPSTAQDTYVNELVAEWLLGCPLEPFDTGWSIRGTQVEEDALGYYRFRTGLAVERPGFIVRDDKKVGCSPDGLVSGDPAGPGGCEIKVVKPATHVGYLLDDVPTKYAPQIQGNMWITGAAWWDLVAYHPTLPSVVVRVWRDNDFIDTLEKQMRGFLVKLEGSQERMRSLGCEPVINPFLPDILRVAA